MSRVGSERSSESLRVVTWNVGEVYWPWQGNQLKDEDVDCVRDALHALDADVVLLQELLHKGQLEAIAGDTHVGHMNPCGYDRHVGAMVRKQCAPSYVDHLLAPTTRGCVEARFTFRDFDVRAFSLHFDVFARPRRLKQVRQAMSIISGQRSALTIAGGDFNYDPAVSRRLDYDDDAQAELAFEQQLRDVARDSGPTLIGLMRVDRVFAGGSVLVDAHSFTSTARTPLGDHAPLVCDLLLSGSPTPR